MTELFTAIIYWVSIIALVCLVLWAGISNNKRKKNLTGKTEKEKFYFGKNNNYNPLKDSQKDIYVSDVVMGVVMVLFIILPFFYIMAYSSVGLREYWNGTGQFVDGLPAEMFAGLSVVSIVTALAGISKGTWLGFDLHYMLKEYKIIKEVKICLILTFVSRVLLFVAKVFLNAGSYELYFAIRAIIVLGFFWYFLLTIRIILHVVEVLLGKNVIRFFADNLYRVLWFDKDPMEDCKFSEKDVIQITEYLLDKYRCAVKSIKQDDWDSIEYDTTIRHKSEQFNSIKLKGSLICSFALTVIAFVLTLNAYNDISSWTYQWGIMVGLGVFFFALGLFFYGFGGLYVTICYGWVSYTFTFKKRKNRKKTLLAREKAIFPRRKLVKYIQVVESILVLYSILLEQEEQLKKCSEINKEDTRLGKTSTVLRCCEEEKEKWEEGKEKMQLLLVAMDYLQFQKTNSLLPGLTYCKGDTSVQLAKGFLIRITKSFDGDCIDETKLNEFLGVKQNMKNEK